MANTTALRAVLIEKEEHIEQASRAMKAKIGRAHV